MDFEDLQRELMRVRLRLINASPIIFLSHVGLLPQWLLIKPGRVRIAHLKLCRIWHDREKLRQSLPWNYGVFLFWFPRSSVGTRFAPLQRGIAALERQCLRSPLERGNESILL
jgi:hypothetical protein